MTKKPTQREMFALVMAAVDTHPNLPDSAKVGMSEFLSGRIAALDKKHNAGPNPKRVAENRATATAILAVLSDEPLRASEIATATGFTVQKVSAHLRKLVAAGEVTRTEGKVTTFTLG